MWTPAPSRACYMVPKPPWRGAAAATMPHWLRKNELKLRQTPSKRRFILSIKVSSSMRRFGGPNWSRRDTPQKPPRGTVTCQGHALGPSWRPGGVIWSAAGPRHSVLSLFSFFWPGWSHFFSKLGPSPKFPPQNHHRLGRAPSWGDKVSGDTTSLS